MWWRYEERMNTGSVIRQRIALGLLLRMVFVVCGLVINMGCSTAPSKVENTIPIGVVNPQRVLKETNLGKKVTDSLNDFMKERQAVVDLEQKELRKLESELRAQGSVLSPTARKQRDEKFRQRMMEYQQKVADLNREVQEKQKELMDEFRTKVKAVVTKVAQAHALLLVLEYGTGTTTLFHQPRLDVTDEVIQDLDREP